MGERALLAEVASLGEVLALHARLVTSRLHGVVDLVPAARTVLVSVDPRELPIAAARAWIAGAEHEEGDAATPAAVVELPIVYDGADLADTAALIGLTAAQLGERHAACVWTVAFTGFAPGFGYLVSAEWPFDIPRLASPRTRVPAGSVGLAGEFSGAYPRATPGGWRLIGTTSAPLFDAASDPPALLAPGTRVRFRPVDAPPSPATSPAAAARAAAARPSAAPSPRSGVPTETGQSPPEGPASAVSGVLGEPRAPGIRVVEPGLLATVQDLGRPAHAAEGIARSGALDRTALRTANRLVGDDEDAAGIEITMGGFSAVAERDLWFAVAGAWGAVLLDGRPVDPYEAHAWPAGARLDVDWFAHGVRGYLAVRGGIEAPAVAGSRASDLLAGLGMPRLTAGDVLAVGRARHPVPAIDLAPWTPPSDDLIEVELAPGPRADWFHADAHRLLFEEQWTVTNESDRTGMRLDGPELVRTRQGELPSEGMVPGALQVPPSGRPTILLADGPVTGGYPVIAVVTDASLDALAQARPGTRLRFRHARPA